MPIRFRCAYCNQLMAISRRKAGTVVRCPKCAGDIIVPSPDGTDPPVDHAPPDNRPLDDMNLDDLLDEDPVKKVATVKAPKENAARAPSTPDIARHRAGLFLPVPWLLGTIAAVVVLSALMFFLGYYVRSRG